ncbi:MAG TPA: aminotransferase class I/II-fold pyridoxal phosphate-dependent enzyme [Bacillales bacterium]|nr:aminotransferase class I/II-fold pyridoxal phosphate-dependent enzyme [Bacillales bacterium]
MSKKFDTQSVHFSQPISHKNQSKTKPIYQTSAFVFQDLDDLESFYQGEKDYLYTRTGNPNTDELGEGTALLENAPMGVAASSGLSAILAGILSVVQSGDHIVACEDLYGGTYQLIGEELSSFGIEATFVSFDQEDAIRKAIRPNTKLLYSESITNPFLREESIKQMVDIARDCELVTMIDNTFATPYLLQPYTQGIDIVVHSATKYIGGHSDVTAGVVVGSPIYMEKAKEKVVNLGLNLSPSEAWLACRGLKTLGVRMEKHNHNARQLADYFRGQDVRTVYYPESVSEKGNGAIVSVDLGENYEVQAFFQNLSWVKIVPTLAGVETTVSYPLSTSHRAVPPEIREKLGITEGLVRLSVGIEDGDEIVEIFDQALKKSKR